METLKFINFIIATTFFCCYAYQFLYILVPYIFKGRKHKETKLHKYAVLIAARNESTVISQLIDSINNQDYPKELVTVFVVADNCTDDTAEKARKEGAVVYERFNKDLVGKGYALDFLLDSIREDYGEEAFDGFFVFDADNLLDESYITEMNKTFSDGYKIITSYRNSKNYGDNWITAGYSLWFLREAKYLNNSRMLLNTSCAVSGTGFMFSREVIQKSGGWKFHLLVEDIEFTVYNIIEGEKIGYCKSAIFYDEQPITFKQSWNQRLRWSKGYIQVFQKYGFNLLKGIFSGKSFACFDMAMTIMPAMVLSILSIIINFSVAIYGAIVGENLLIAIQSVGETLLNSSLTMIFIGAVTTISEWKNIHTSVFKKILFIFTFPIFMLTYIPISFVALFKKVEWKPIHHSIGKELKDVRESQKEAA